MNYDDKARDLTERTEDTARAVVDGLRQRVTQEEVMGENDEPEMTEYPNGRKEWLLDGRLHRLDGPAYTGADGHKEWWRYGLLHRSNGPAVIWSDGTVDYWLHGKRVTKDDLEQ